jgi:hypothetical protein
VTVTIYRIAATLIVSCMSAVVTVDIASTVKATQMALIASCVRIITIVVPKNVTACRVSATKLVLIRVSAMRRDCVNASQEWQELSVTVVKLIFTTSPSADVVRVVVPWPEARTTSPAARLILDSKPLFSDNFSNP